MSSRYRLMLVAGRGGVLLDLLALRPWWQRHDVVWAAVEAADTTVALAGQVVHWQRALAPWARPGAVVRAVRLLQRSRTELVVSSGGGAAPAFLVAARLLRVPTIWVERSRGEAADERQTAFLRAEEARGRARAVRDVEQLAAAVATHSRRTLGHPLPPPVADADLIATMDAVCAGLVTTRRKGTPARRPGPGGSAT